MSISVIVDSSRSSCILLHPSAHSTTTCRLVQMRAHTLIGNSKVKCPYQAWWYGLAQTFLLSSKWPTTFLRICVRNSACGCHWDFQPRCGNWIRDTFGRSKTNRSFAQSVGKRVLLSHVGISQHSNPANAINHREWSFEATAIESPHNVALYILAFEFRNVETGVFCIKKQSINGPNTFRIEWIWWPWTDALTLYACNHTILLTSSADFWPAFLFTFRMLPVLITPLWFSMLNVCVFFLGSVALESSSRWRFSSARQSKHSLKRANADNIVWIIRRQSMYADARNVRDVFRDEIERTSIPTRVLSVERLNDYWWWWWKPCVPCPNAAILRSKCRVRVCVEFLNIEKHLNMHTQTDSMYKLYTHTLPFR